VLRKGSRWQAELSNTQNAMLEEKLRKICELQFASDHQGGHNPLFENQCINDVGAGLWHKLK
jgi:hypothetical protein